MEAVSFAQTNASRMRGLDGGLRWLVAGLCALVLLPSVSAADGEIYMTATFDDKVIDEPIGTGGPAVGEPSSVTNMTAVVRATPFATPCLEFCNTATYGRARFDLPGVISEGIVALVADVWVHEEVPCQATLILHNDYNQIMTELWLRSDRTLQVWDLNGYVVEDTPYLAGQPLPILFVVDLDADTYSIWVDEEQIVTDRPLHAQIRDFESFELTTSNDCAPGNRFSIDQIRILSWAPPVPAEGLSWGRLRAMFR